MSRLQGWAPGAILYTKKIVMNQQGMYKNLSSNMEAAYIYAVNYT